MSITFVQIGASAVYQPKGAAPSDRLGYLSTSAAAQIALADTWANVGAPASPGYFLFLDRQPDAVEAKAIETLLLTDPSGQQLPPKPVATGLVWLRLATGTPALVSAVETGLGPANAPLVISDTVISAEPGQNTLGVGKDAPVAGEAVQGAWQGLTVKTPPQPAAGLQPPSWPSAGSGLTIDLSPATAGQIASPGFLPAAAHTTEVEMSLVDVLIDPAEPLNSGTVFTGRSYLLVTDATGIHLRGAGQFPVGAELTE